MFGERLRVARARKRMTLKELAAECGVTAQAVKKYEDGACMPNSAAFTAICRCLDVSAEWLMDPTPLDFRSTAKAPEGRHAKYWVREAISELAAEGILAPCSAAS